MRSVTVLIFFFVGVSFAHAANLYLEPQSGTYSEGSSFPVKLRIDTQAECINAAQVILEYPNTSIRAIDVVRGESIFSLWPEDPVIDHEAGTVTFSGGLPGGYCGRVEGDPGFTNVIAEIIFQVPGLTIGEKGPNTGAISIAESSAVLLNDGRGTNAEVIAGSSVFNIVPPGEAITEFDWFRSVSEDQIKPEPFSIELARNESVWDGQWFIIFNTLDKQSGIDHFEVYETDIEREGYMFGGKEKMSSWKRAVSPYLLEDQSLNSVIRVRAYDKAGNDRLAGLKPDETLRETVKKPISKGVFYTLLAVIGLGVLGGIVVLMYRRLKKKNDEVRDTIKESDENVEGDAPQESVPPDTRQNEGNNEEHYNQNTEG